MSDLMTREERSPGLFDRLDRMFDEMTGRMGMTRWPTFDVVRMGERMIKVDEFREGDELVIRAELPGIDPDKDVELTVSHGMLEIRAERRTEETSEDRGYMRRELHYGSFTRSLPLPEGVDEDRIVANYTNGILEVRVPMPAPAKTKKVEVLTS